jgi:hypothetical protein
MKRKEGGNGKKPFLEDWFFCFKTQIGILAEGERLITSYTYEEIEAPRGEIDERHLI